MNQDTHYCNDDLGIYIVADGMGGQQGGEIASRLAVETMIKYFNPSISEKQTCDIESKFDHSISEQANLLVSSIFFANTAIFQKALEESQLHGMGSTISAVYLTGETVIVANVGDSPVYLIRDDEIQPLFVSHSMESEFEIDHIFFKQAKHMLTRAVGVETDVRVDSCEIHCFENDLIILCSDGLSNLVAKEKIKEIVEKENPDSACRTLVELANEHGGSDNITIIIVKVHSFKHKKIKGWIQKMFHAFFYKISHKML